MRERRVLTGLTTAATMGGTIRPAFFLVGMAGIIAALRPHHDVRGFGEKINDLAFAFVAPLGADQNRIGHELKRNKGWI